MAEFEGKSKDPFTIGQKVFLVDTNRVEIDKIRQGLSPEIASVNSFDELVDFITDRFSNSTEAFVTLIITENVPSELQQNWKQVIEGINTLSNSRDIFIFEITKEDTPVFDNAIIFHDIDELLLNANNIHINSITSSDLIDEESRSIISALQIQNEKNLSLAEQRKEKIDELNASIKEKSDRIDYLSEIVDSANFKVQQAEKVKSESNEKVKNAEIEINVVNKKLDEANIALTSEREKNIKLEMSVEANKSTIESYSAEINSLQQQIIDNEKAIVDLQNVNDKLSDAKTEVEGMGVLREELRAQKEKVLEYSKENISLKTKATSQATMIENLNKSIENIRSGYKDISRIGYSNKFQKIELKSTNVLYFKVIESIPYHRFYIDLIKKSFDAMTDNREQKFVTVILKINEGLDEKKFSDYTLISSLGDISDVTDKYLLIPSQHMGEKIEDFEQEGRNLIFIDYIDNDEYYIETKGLIDTYTIIQNSSDMKKLGLSGKDISYSRSSEINIAYDRNIINMTSKNKDKEYVKRIAKFLQNSKVIVKLL